MDSIARHHSIRLPMAADAALPLFTPLGEREWIAEWDPVFLYPEDGHTCEGMAFETVHGGVHAIWTCARWQPDRHAAKYVRVAPGSHLAIIDVACAAMGDAETEVSVAYRLTALSAAGDRYLAEITEAAFAQMIGGWRALLATRYGFG